MFGKILLTLHLEKMNKVMMDIQKAALFDLDGVIFDTEPQYTEFWRAQCGKFHPDIPGLELAIKGQTLTQIFDAHFNGELLAVRGLIEARLNDFEQHMAFDYVEGLPEFVVKLKEKGFRTAIVTSSNKMKMNAVYQKRPELEQMFDAILTAEDFERSKPDPDCYLKGAEHLGATPKHSIAFEDSFNGLKAARAAAMSVCGLATTNPQEAIASMADVVIDNFAAENVLLNNIIDSISNN